MQKECVLVTLFLLERSLPAVVLCLSLFLSELRRVYCRVVQHTSSSYQLVSKYGLISGRYQYNQLNGVDQDMSGIPRMTVLEARNAPKVSFPKIVADMNSRGAISAEQRAGRGRRMQNTIEEENRREAIAARRCARSLTGDEIEVNRPATRRPQAPSSSPTAGPSARNTAKRGGNASTQGSRGGSRRGRSAGLT
jgi:hypothetical protein